MIMLLLVLLLSVPLSPLTPDDVRMTIAVEDFVIDSTPRGQKNLDTRFPGSDLPTLIRMLGCEHCEHREYARNRLAAVGEAVIPALAWGLRHRDPEITHRCGVILDEFCPCDRCETTGYEDDVVWSNALQKTVYGRRPCIKCGGDGSLR